MTSSTQTATLTTSTLSMRVVGGRRLRWARVIWAILVALTIVYGVANWLVYTAGRLEPCAAEPCGVMQLAPQAAEQYISRGVPFAAAALLRPILEAVMVIAYCGVGILLFWQRSDDWMGLLSGLTLCLLGFQLTYSIETLPVVIPQTLPISLMLSLAMSVVAYTALYLFPSGKLEPRWAAILLAVTLAYELPRGVFLNVPQLGVNVGQMLIGTLVLCLAGLWVQVWRYRRLNQTERQQVKWLVLAFGWLVGGLALSAVQRAVLPSLDGGAFVIGSLLAVVIQHGLYLGLPAAFAFSMLRYRLWDADLAINKTLVYVSSFMVLAVITFGVFLVLNAVFVGLLGVESNLSVWIAVLTALALFAPVSRRLASLIDRKVYGLRVDLAELGKQSAAETYFIPTGEKQTGAHTGSQVGVYQVGALLGKGAMSEVYTAQDVLSQDMVALKILPPTLAEHPQALERFRREGKALARLNHPNIVRLVGTGMSGSLHYLAMEWVGIQTLADRLNQPIPLDEAVGYIRDIGVALDAAHTAGVIHRDVKPSNILLRPIGTRLQAVLSDFGVAKLTDEESETNQREQFVGTPYYAAPEQITSATVIDYRADIYALGVVAYQVLTGRHPFKVSPTAVVFAHLNRPPTDPQTLRPELPKTARAALFKALAKTPDERFASASAFATALIG